MATTCKEMYIMFTFQPSGMIWKNFKKVPSFLAFHNKTFLKWDFKKGSKFSYFFNRFFFARQFKMTMETFSIVFKMIKMFSSETGVENYFLHSLYPSLSFLSPSILKKVFFSRWRRVKEERESKGRKRVQERVKDNGENNF